MKLVTNVAGYTFLRWQKDGSDYATAQFFSYTVDGPYTFTTIFVQNPIPEFNAPQLISILVLLTALVCVRFVRTNKLTGFRVSHVRINAFVMQLPKTVWG